MHTLRSSLAPIASAVRMLGAEALTPRPAGRPWQRKRAQLQVDQGSRCQRCGRLWLPERDQVDHRVPRERGGSDGDANLDLLCDECHAAKTAVERAGGDASVYERTPCRFCGYPFDQDLLGIYGCPNCLGEPDDAGEKKKKGPAGYSPAGPRESPSRQGG